MLSPWSSPIDPEILFNRDDLESLIFDFGWTDPASWLDHWLNRRGLNLASSALPFTFKNDWIWGLCLPFLSDIERNLLQEKEPMLFGISGLPGCGKSTFGRWIEAVSHELKWPVTVISMDDFYFPSTQMAQEIAGNPWNVPRALPGSHSIQLIEKTINSWIKQGELNAPQFDKSLRHGLGDRSGWRRSRPRILIIEGWFLGCSLSKANLLESQPQEMIVPPLSESEKLYRLVVQKSLQKYQPIWNKFDRIWHLKASQFHFTRTWKTEQESNMEIERGFSLKGNLLKSFIRMIEASIPQVNLQTIDADIIVEMNIDRQITRLEKSKSN